MKWSQFEFFTCVCLSPIKYIQWNNHNTVFTVCFPFEHTDKKPVLATKPSDQGCLKRKALVNFYSGGWPQPLLWITGLSFLCLKVLVSNYWLKNLKLNFLMKFRVIYSFPFKTYHLLKVQCFTEKLWYANCLPSR